MLSEKDAGNKNGFDQIAHAHSPVRLFFTAAHDGRSDWRVFGRFELKLIDNDHQ